MHPAFVEAIPFLTLGASSRFGLVCPASPLRLFVHLQPSYLCSWICYWLIRTCALGLWLSCGPLWSFAFVQASRPSHRPPALQPYAFRRIYMKPPWAYSLNVSEPFLCSPLLIRLTLRQAELLLLAGWNFILKINLLNL